MDPAFRPSSSGRSRSPRARRPAAATCSLGRSRWRRRRSYAANVAASTPVSPRGSRVGFYQTLPDDSAPYLIDQHPVDPLSGELATNATLSSATTIAFGTFGTSFTLTAAAPQEGAGKYSVAALSPFYGNGSFSNTLLAAPAATTDVAGFTVPDVQIPSTSASGTITAQVSAAHAAGKYNKGALLVTHNGAVVTTVPLDDALAGSATSATVRCHRHSREQRVDRSIAGSTTSRPGRGTPRIRRARSRERQ